MSVTWVVKMLGTRFLVYPEAYVLHYAHTRQGSTFESGGKHKELVRALVWVCLHCPYMSYPSSRVSRTNRTHICIGMATLSMFVMDVGCPCLLWLIRRQIAIVLMTP